jgi:putative oxidoreductase
VTDLSDRVREAYRRVSQTKDVPVTRDVAMVVARVALAWIFIYHGARTLFGAFGGPGVHQASIFYGTIAHLHPATFFTVLGGSIEFFGGIAVGLGVLGRLAAAALAGDMAVAMATVTFGNGMASSAPGGGYELNLALAALATVVALLGSGHLALDVAVKRPWQNRAASNTQVVGVSYENRPEQISAT